MPSSGNFAVWNRLAKVNPSLSYSGFILDKGNIRFRGNTGGTASMTSTLSMPSGKWYIEFYVENNPAGGWPTLGLTQTKYIAELQNVSNYQTSYNPGPTANSEVIGTNGNIKKWGASSSISSGSGWSNTDIVQIAVDIDAGKWWFGKNNTWYASGNPATGANPIDTITAGTELSVWTASYSGSSYLYMNAGQDSSFSGNITAGSGVDDSGFGNFKYSPPSGGFKALCSGNLPISSDIDVAQTDDNIPTKQFFMSQYAGNLTNRTITTAAQPDLIWIRSVAHSQNWYIVDSSRGITANKYFKLDTSDAEATFPQSNFTSVGSTSVGISNGTWLNSTGQTIQMWMWKAKGGTETTNNDGNTTTTIQANTEAGFSIVRHSSSLPSSGTLGHGLNKAPEFVMHKLISSNNWNIWHKGLSSGAHILRGNTNAAESSTTHFGSAPTTSVINTGASLAGSGGGIVYAWHGVEGYSKFGSWVANGNSDGPYIHLGFRPSLLVLRRYTGTDSFFHFDTLRSPTNGIGNFLFWDTNSAQSGSNLLDITSQGFKMRTTSASLNPSGTTLIYMAWADQSGKYSNAF